MQQQGTAVVLVDDFHLKANLLMQTVISGAVRTRFDQCIPPNELQSELKLLPNRYFTKKQISILDPKNGRSSSKDYDITLMMAVLRHCNKITAIPIKGLGELPLPNEQGEEADLARIKYYRNKVIHLPGQLSTSEFDEFIKILKPAAERLAGRNLDKEFDEVSKLHISEKNRDFGNFIPIMIGAYGVVYVSYFSKNGKYIRDGSLYNFCLFTSPNQNDQTVLTDWSRKPYYRKCYLADPFLLIPNTLSWCPPPTDSRSHSLLFTYCKASRCWSLNVDDKSATKISLFHRKDEENNFDNKSSDNYYDVVIPHIPKGSRDPSEDTCHVRYGCHVPRDTTRKSSSGFSLGRSHTYEATHSSPSCLDENVFSIFSCLNDSPCSTVRFKSSISIANSTDNISICPSSGSRDTSEDTESLNRHVPRETTRNSSSGFFRGRSHTYEATHSSPSCLDENVFSIFSCLNDSPCGTKRFKSSILIADSTNNINICPSLPPNQEVDSFSTSTNGFLEPVTIRKKQEGMQYVLAALSLVLFPFLLYKLLVHKSNSEIKIARFPGCRETLGKRHGAEHFCMGKRGRLIANKYDK